MSDDTSPRPPAPPPAGAAAREDLSPAQQARESLIDYPTRFPIKVVGLNEDGFVHAMTHLVRQFDPGFDAATIELRASGGGKYLGLTFTVLATSREQLDELYRTLSTHPMAKWVL
jgi:putative lipoic acid-binding regulatory protein